jgi:hypothetical protein
MADHEGSNVDEDFQSGEIEDEELEKVNAAGASVNMTYDNNSNNKDNSQIVIFDKP